jgi:hypothetical protein
MTRLLSIATATLGHRPLVAPDLTISEPGRVVMARALLSLPKLVEAWRDEAAKIRACGDEGKAAGMEKCAADVEAAIGTNNGREAPRSDER